jgi:ADP-dependent NAD(P)H-hydrate dehydratase / NAD(P)H-hydrate epimerase
MHSQVYHSSEIQAWEQRWFNQHNSSYGLMQQVAWQMSQKIIPVLIQRNIRNIAVCCGQGNNAGDGYLVAQYLVQYGFNVHIYAAEKGPSQDLAQASHQVVSEGVCIYTGFDFLQAYDCYIDALFGIGLNRELDESWQKVIQNINTQHALKIAIDIPSGLNVNTGQALPCAIKADFTYSVLGLKAGLFTGQAKEYVGQVDTIALIPVDHQLKKLAQLTSNEIILPKRKAFGHKGNYGHAVIIGGHPNMGGAVIMAAEAAFATGAGKVTVVCHARHHSAILARSPNIMLKDIDGLSQADISEFIAQVDVVAFGMGLGRDEWAKAQFDTWFSVLQDSALEVVLDADALWFLAEQHNILGPQTYLTPHPGEAAKLLACTTRDIEADRIFAIQQLQQKYKGQWVLKGAGSLILEEEQLWICTAGNAGMGTGGMGDILSGMIVGLKAQFKDMITLHDIVTLHALAGDELAKQGIRGLQAQDMSHAIYKIINI